MMAPPMMVTMADDISSSESTPVFRGCSSLSGLDYFWVYFTDLSDDRVLHCKANQAA
jgi:hypothetical protein